MSENSRRFLKAMFGFDATVRRVAESDWACPSPCEGWTAADVVAHNIGMSEMIIGFTQGQDATQPTETALDDPNGAWAESFSNLQDALDREGALQTVSVTPWGEMAVEKFLGFVWVDPLVHTWDLAKATAQQPVLDQQLVERGYKQLERAGDSLRGPGRFGAAVEENESMSMLDRFIAITGRDPR